MTRIHLGEFEHLLLLALSQLGADASGVDVRELIERRTGRTISPGAIYTAMQRLERRGFVGAVLGDPTPQRGGKRRRLYRLRAAGTRALMQAQNALAEMGRGLKPRASIR
jgi:DNA-binding PadR family transcriptional regulator